VFFLVSVLSLAMTIVALAAVKTAKKSSGDISVPVPDEQTGVKKLNITKRGKIKDVNVTVAADHNEIKDLTFLLESPKGKFVHLSSGNGGSGSGYGSGVTDGCASTMSFDDEATDDVQDYEGVDHVFSGPYKPESFYINNPGQGLAALDGTQMKGKWKLIVMDTEEIGGGELQCFKLRIRYNTPN
jgi:subtilisin-like proprotein convertase family protein